MGLHDSIPQITCLSLFMKFKSFIFDSRYFVTRNKYTFKSWNDRFNYLIALQRR